MLAEGMDNNTQYNVWTWENQARVRSISAAERRSRFRATPVLSFDTLISSVFEDPKLAGQRFDKSFTAKSIHQSNRLPAWLWALITVTLGIGNKYSACIGTFLHGLTILSGLWFGACGLYFNVYDTLSSFTRTTVLVCLAKIIIGLSWILLGIYSHSLAARLFSNSRMTDCIRLHSKSFMKINMVIIIAFLTISVLVINIYADTPLLDQTVTTNVTGVYNTNCASLGIKIILCHMYFVSKIVYSILSLCWNLMVAAVCLSVCRTLTIGIRRFLRELSIDSQIFEEYHMMKAGVCRPRRGCNAENNFTKSWSIWDDDIQAGFDDDSDTKMPSSRENILNKMRSRGENSLCQENASISVLSGGDVINDHGPQEFLEYAQDQATINIQEIHTTSGRIKPMERVDSCTCEAVPMEDSQNISKKDDEDNDQMNGPPIMSNQDLMFTYFKFMRRMTSTSRLLQRWMSCWVTFVVLWCMMLVIYWTSHHASVLDVAQLFIPIICIGLLTSAYAEVNFEGNRVHKFIIPTDERMSVIFYIQNCQLELKIFSFVMTYNVLLTVWAGVALTIASRIIIDQFR